MFVCSHVVSYVNREEREVTRTSNTRFDARNIVPGRDPTYMDFSSDKARSAMLVRRHFSFLPE